MDFWKMTDSQAEDLYAWVAGLNERSIVDCGELVEVDGEYVAEG